MKVNFLSDPQSGINSLRPALYICYKYTNCTSYPSNPDVILRICQNPSSPYALKEKFTQTSTQR